ncbi:hypothetical protein Pse7367_1073 [Thalassoporum mexicanum PCC 7367]|uniref:hypothetical protein n=1 Tax=Thalassoporum mexicanum TaxID=3457544 RepID=UPI00029F9472|nr:hypothetical protein [Pseudanabaena sp. PCC 7367]AFY69370.1 hypothetical protein Pse7367_1073 [Pseudanabaena sp. PCC 7367]
MSVSKTDENQNSTKEKSASTAKSANGNAALTVKGAAKSSEIVYEMAPLPNNRPIVAAHLDVKELYGRNRPIIAGKHEIRETFGESRPVFASTHHYRTADGLPGGRPVFASSIVLSKQNSGLPNNRPMFPNKSTGVSALMGYLD